jgi:glycosyltransferase involved in cell wall biosynthesis
MRILYHHRVGSKDGQYVHIAEMIGALRAAGHDVRIVGPSAYEGLEFGGQRGLVARLRAKLPRWFYELLEIGYSFADFVRLVLAFRAYRPDIVYERYNLHLYSGAWLRRFTRTPLVLEVNAPLAEERGRYGGLALPGLARRGEAYTWRSADFVLPVTHVLAGHLRRAGVEAGRIRVVPNGVGHEFLVARDRAAAKARAGVAGATVLGFTGFIREWHRLERVIELLARHPGENWRFLVVGDGPARAGLEALARERGVADRVIFTGLVGRERMPELVAAFDIALQPDVVPYASPLKLFEYLALGCAVVAPASANILEILSDGENALLFRADDDAGFANAIARLAQDRELRETLGRRGRATLDERGLKWDENARVVVGLT